MKDVLLWSRGEVPKLGPRRIGIHNSTAGGVQAAAERAYRLGANTFQIFSSSPRQWKPYVLGKTQCDEMRGLREKYGIAPLAIHCNYLVNLASATPEFVDVDAATYTLDPEKLREYLEHQCRRDGSRGRLVSKRSGRPVTASRRSVQKTSVPGLSLVTESTGNLPFREGGRTG